MCGSLNDVVETKGERADCSNTEEFLSHKQTEGKPLATLTPGGQQGTGDTPNTFNVLHKVKFEGLGQDVRKMSHLIILKAASKTHISKVKKLI